MKVYFPGLNQLRALAALAVIPGHIEQFKDAFKLQTTYWFPIPGKLGVVLFFALSGFLITTLLLRERRSRGTINLRVFFKRRSLRILPLYFLIITLSFFVFNRISFLQVPVMSAQVYEKMDFGAALLFLLVLPNFVQFIVPYAAHTWSIGIEEQFYLIQPLLMKLIGGAWIFSAAMFIVVFLPEILPAINQYFKAPVLTIFYQPAVYFGCIAIGSLGAFFYNVSPGVFRRFLFHRATQFVSLFAFVISIVRISITGDENVIDFRFHAVWFTVFVINSAANDSSFLRINSEVLDQIGKISYGLYIYHPICIGAAIAIAMYFPFATESYVAFNIIIYTLTFGLTFAISAMSYKFFESYFLSLKSSSRI